jgi:hypothetical protein
MRPPLHRRSPARPASMRCTAKHVQPKRRLDWKATH